MEIPEIFEEKGVTNKNPLIPAIFGHKSGIFAID